MPELERSAPTRQPSPQAPARTSSGRTLETGPQDTLGNAALQDELQHEEGLGAQLPETVALERLGLSFTIPGGLNLTGGWNPLTTQGLTRVWLSVSPAGLELSMNPPLLVDAVWPLSNVAITGATYDFATASLSDVRLSNTQLGIGISGSVEAEIRSFVVGALRGTPLGKAGYDPLGDTDLSGTLAAVQAGFASNGPGSGGGTGLRPEDMGGLAAFATVKTNEEVFAGAGGGGVRLAGGASLDLWARIAGNGATVGSAPPELQSLNLSATGLTLEQGGEAVAELQGLTVYPGGRVDVTRFKPLGRLARYGAGESFVRLLGLLAVIADRGGSARDLGRVDGQVLEPGVVNGMAEKKIEEALTEAVQGALSEHHDALPGLDLRRLFGVQGAGAESS